jgi:hypothetical protein
MPFSIALSKRHSDLTPKSALTSPAARERALLESVEAEG